MNKKLLDGNLEMTLQVYKLADFCMIDSLKAHERVAKAISRTFTKCSNESVLFVHMI